MKNNTHINGGLDKTLSIYKVLKKSYSKHKSLKFQILIAKAIFELNIHCPMTHVIIKIERTITNDKMCFNLGMLNDPFLGIGFIFFLLLRQAILTNA